jgi:hypothetical protein
MRFSARSSVGLLAVLGVALTACSAGGSSSPTAAQPAPSASPSAAAAQPSPAPGAFGTVAAITATNAQVQDPSTGQVTVNFTPSTVFTQEKPATSATLMVGKCVSVTVVRTGTSPPSSPPAQPVPAASVTVSEPVSGGCQAGLVGGGVGGARASGAPRPSGTPRPSGSARQGGNGTGRVVGKITSVTGSDFSVEETNRQSAAGTTATVQTDGATTFAETVPVPASALAVGQCVTALGPADSTGLVAATVIGIRPAGANGCGNGFRGGNGGSDGSQPGSANG